MTRALGGNSVETSKDESISNMTNKSHDKKDRLVQQRIAQFDGVKTAGLKDFYVRSNDESEKSPTKKNREDIVPKASHIVPTHSIRNKSKVQIEVEGEKVMPNIKDLPERPTIDLPNTEKEPEKESEESSRETPDMILSTKMKEVSDEASVKSSNVTWSTKKKQIADRVEKISSKFEEIQRAIRPSENVSSSNSNDTILDSPTRNKIIEEEIRKYELQIANNFPSPNVSTPEPENFNGQHFHTPGEKTSDSSQLPAKMRTSTKVVLKDLVRRLESIDDISPISSPDENQNAFSQTNKEVEKIMANKATNDEVSDSNISQPEWKRSVYKRDTALPLTSILPAENLQYKVRVKEVSDSKS